MFINLLINNNKTKFKFKMLYKGKNISSWHAWVISPSNIMASYRKSYVRSTQVLTRLTVALKFQYFPLKMSYLSLYWHLVKPN